jgi:alpha-ketoglutarate-dependent taurine dioxygenase
MNKPLNAWQGRPITEERGGITVNRVGVNLGAEVRGVDLRQPIQEKVFRTIEETLVENELIIFRDQEITSDNLMDFGRRFGELTVHPFSPNEATAPQLIKFRNDETNAPFGTDVWHSDETFRAEPPMATILCAKEVPSIGGDTVFVSMSAAFDGLSARMQHLISGLEAIHDLKPFRALFGGSEEDRKNLQHFEFLYPPQVHPVVRIHPVSGRKVLVRQSSIHHRDQRHGRAGEPLPPRHAVSSGSYSRISIPSPLGASYHCHVGQSFHPALRGQRLLSAAAVYGAGDHSRWARDWRPARRPGKRPQGQVPSPRERRSAWRPQTP